MPAMSAGRRRNFNPRPPRGGRPTKAKKVWRFNYISIHAPREGGDWWWGTFCCRRSNFNPRPPRGGRRGEIQRHELGVTISIHAPREGGDAVLPYRHPGHPEISIHAPREGGDQVGDLGGRAHRISIHAPREGGDNNLCYTLLLLREFQSTPPARGATPRLSLKLC